MTTTSERIISEIEKSLLEETKKNTELMRQLWASDRKIEELRRDLLVGLLTASIPAMY